MGRAPVRLGAQCDHYGLSQFVRTSLARGAGQSLLFLQVRQNFPCRAEFLTQFLHRGVGRLQSLLLKLDESNPAGVRTGLRRCAFGWGRPGGHRHARQIVGEPLRVIQTSLECQHLLPRRPRRLVGGVRSGITVEHLDPDPEAYRPRSAGIIGVHPNSDARVIQRQGKPADPDVGRPNATRGRQFRDPRDDRPGGVYRDAFDLGLDHLHTRSIYPPPSFMAADERE